MTDPEILAKVREAVSDWISRIGTGEVSKDAAVGAILSLRLNEKGEPDPEGNIRVGVYLEKASFAPFAGIPYGFRKVVR